MQAHDLSRTQPLAHAQVVQTRYLQHGISTKHKLDAKLCMQQSVFCVCSACLLQCAGFPSTYCSFCKVHRPLWACSCVWVSYCVTARVCNAGRAFANAAAFRRLHPEWKVEPSQALPLDQVK